MEGWLDRPLPEPMLTYHQRGSVSIAWEQFQKKSSPWVMNLIRKCSQIPLMESLPHLPGANELRQVSIGSGIIQAPGHSLNHWWPRSLTYIYMCVTRSLCVKTSWGQLTAAGPLSLIGPWHTIFCLWHKYLYVYPWLWFTPSRFTYPSSTENLARSCDDIMTCWHEKAVLVTGLLWGETTQKIPCTKGQQCVAWLFSLLLAWTICWINSGIASDLRCHHGHARSL